MATASAAEASG